jgi:hypothetical protein
MGPAIEGEDEEGAVFSAIREALSRTTLEVAQYSENGIFSDIDSFVKLSQGNSTSITVVDFYPFDKEGDDTLWEKVGQGLANLESLAKFNIVIFADTDEQTADFGTLALVLPYLRQRLDIFLNGNFYIAQDWSREEVKLFARAIRRHPTIKAFDIGDLFPLDTLDIIFSALATLPSLEVAKVGNRELDDDSEQSEHSEALTELLRSPSLRQIDFNEFCLGRALCHEMAAALTEGSAVTRLVLNCCILHREGGGALARALKQNVTLTEVLLLDNHFSEEFYDSLATALLVNNTLTDLELQVPQDMPHYAWLSPVFQALGMNKGLKNLTMGELGLADDSLLLALRDGLEHNSTLEVLSMSANVDVGASSISLSKVVPFLRINRTLKCLYLSLPGLVPMNPCVGALYLDSVATLRENSSLETLEILSNGIAPDTYFAALESLQPNTSLKTLRLCPCLKSMSDAEIQRLVSTATKNYRLESLDDEIVSQSWEVGVILHLNRAGRCYLIEDAASIEKGVEVLVAVRDDLACLYYHLLENPLLCDSGAPSTKVSRRGTKRIRPSH